MYSLFRTSLTLFAVLTFLTGVIYPMAITGIAQVAFPEQAGGSPLLVNGRVVGSELIGQPFSDPKYFHGRPSVTSGFPSNAQSGSGSNLAPTNPVLLNQVRERIKELSSVVPSNSSAIPIDLVTASASGLDPHISRDAADYQAAAIAAVRHLELRDVRILIDQHTESPRYGLGGLERVNVLKLNLALDQLDTK